MGFSHRAHRPVLPEHSISLNDRLKHQRSLTVRVGQKLAQKDLVVLNMCATFRTMPLRPASETPTQSPIQIPIARTELEDVVICITINLDRAGWTEERRRLEEYNLVIRVETHRIDEDRRRTQQDFIPDDDPPS